MRTSCHTKLLLDRQKINIIKEWDCNYFHLNQQLNNLSLTAEFFLKIIDCPEFESFGFLSEVTKFRQSASQTPSNHKNYNLFYTKENVASVFLLHMSNLNFFKNQGRCIRTKAASVCALKTCRYCACGKFEMDAKHLTRTA